MGHDPIQKAMGPLALAAGIGTTVAGAPEIGLPMMSAGFGSTMGGMSGGSKGAMAGGMQGGMAGMGPGAPMTAGTLPMMKALGLGGMAGMQQGPQSGAMPQPPPPQQGLRPQNPSQGPPAMPQPSPSPTPPQMGGMGQGGLSQMQKMAALQAMGLS